MYYMWLKVTTCYHSLFLLLTSHLNSQGSFCSVKITKQSAFTKVKNKVLNVQYSVTKKDNSSGLVKQF